MDLIDDPAPGQNAPEFSVSELSGAVKRVIEGEFAHVRVKGEVGRVSRPRSGHVYTTLKDDKANLDAVIWKGNAARLAQGVARHPSQLYAAIAEGLIPFFYVQLRFWRTSIIQKYPGQLAGEFLVLYSIARILNEIFREPDASLIAGISRGQFYSVFLLIAGILIILWSRNKNNSLN